MGTSSTFCSLPLCCSKHFRQILNTPRYYPINSRANIKRFSQGYTSFTHINRSNIHTTPSTRSTTLTNPITNTLSLYDLLTQNQLETAWNLYYSENYDTINGPKLEWFVFYKFMVRIYSSSNSSKWDQLDLLISNFSNINSITSSDYLIWMEANFHLNNFDKVRQIFQLVKDSSYQTLPGHYLMLLRVKLAESDNCIESGLQLLQDFEDSGIQREELGLSFLYKLIQTSIVQPKSDSLLLCREILSNWYLKDPQTATAGYEMTILHLLRMGNQEEAEYYYVNHLKSMEPSNHFFVQVFCIIDFQFESEAAEVLVVKWLNYMVELGMDLKPELVSRLYRPLLSQQFSQKSFDFYCKLFERWPITYQSYLSSLFYNYLLSELDYTSIIDYIERLPNSSYEGFTNEYLDLLVENLSPYYPSHYKVLFPTSLHPQAFIQKALLSLINLSIHHNLSGSIFQRLIDMYHSFEFDNNDHIYNLLIKYYIQRGDPIQALEIYDSFIQESNNVSILLKIADCFFNIGNSSQGYSLLHRAKDIIGENDNLSTDYSSILTEIKVLAQLKDFRRLESLLNEHINSNFIENWDYRIFHTIAESFITLNRFQSAEKVIKVMSDLGLPQNQKTFDILLKFTRIISNSKDRYDSQFKIYQKMKYCNISPSTEFIVILVSSSISSYGLSFGLSLLNRINSDFPDAQERTAPLALVRYANDTLLPDLAKYFFSNVNQDRLSTSDNQFIKKYLDRCLYIEEEEIALNTIDEYIVDITVLNTEAFGSLLRVYMKSGLLDSALTLFEQYVTHLGPRSTSSDVEIPSISVKIMNIMLQHAEYSNDDQIKKLVEFSQINKIHLTRYSLSIIVNCLLKADNPQNAYYWIEYFKTQFNILADTFIYNNFIIYYALEKHEIERGAEVIQTIYKLGLKPNQPTYHTLIRECINQSKFELATSLYREMILNLSPTQNSSKLLSHTRFLLVQSAIHQDRKDIADSIIQLT
ncbi:hypothetical protein CONCODRAFT_69567 [Conidiobolus coronatus NRRL 28638]|uniref:Pentacotripeptide-repeat region of PRORP domain-containing protein n=1 Tax=Conidiobolus coronatus (strain ATCC 28846 / CBS 209.66 / NRRL 28638) TaxID=796925 RepID=A0A137P9Y8_CONC2|nr:hypothetical protein CONCODRAFT_69567 [Conidiobolus coronatus NRRL 28638]|eukprot:KXN71774.1 hypothetical protein CONCODRAFT_69567 [Conidiobolus coronatus NRRL 28638]